jgi:hypothetical protein
MGLCDDGSSVMGLFFIYQLFVVQPLGCMLRRTSEVLLDSVAASASRCVLWGDRIPG